MSEERIKETEIADADLVVVIAKLTDPAYAKPYETFSMCLRSGYASPIAYFATEVEALTAHDELVAHMSAPRVSRAMPSPFDDDDERGSKAGGGGSTPPV